MTRSLRREPLRGIQRLARRRTTVFAAAAQSILAQLYTACDLFQKQIPARPLPAGDLYGSVCTNVVWECDFFDGSVHHRAESQFLCGDAYLQQQCQASSGIGIRRISNARDGK